MARHQKRRVISGNPSGSTDLVVLRKAHFFSWNLEERFTSKSQAQLNYLYGGLYWLCMYVSVSYICLSRTGKVNWPVLACGCHIQVSVNLKLWLCTPVVVSGLSFDNLVKTLESRPIASTWSNVCYCSDEAKESSDCVFWQSRGSHDDGPLNLEQPIGSKGSLSDFSPCV